jgi:hypothetical protein
MFAKDKRDGLSKEGSSRVALFLATDFPMCFVLECNYNKGKQTNMLFPPGKQEKYKLEENKFGKLTSEKLINYELPYNSNTEVFDLEIFEKVGKAIGVSLLDYIGRNPLTRLNNCPL